MFFKSLLHTLTNLLDTDAVAIEVFSTLLDTFLSTEIYTSASSLELKTDFEPSLFNTPTDIVSLYAAGNS